MILTSLLTWINIPDRAAPISKVSVSFAADPAARINTRGGYFDKEIFAQAVTVDNTGNTVNINVTFNQVTNFVSANTRSTFPLPQGTTYVDLAGASGATSLTFYANAKDAPNDAPNYAAIIQQTVAASKVAHGQCRLSLSGANLLLSPKNGNNLIIAATAQNVPALGVTLGPGGLIANTLYYIYAFMTAGVMTLEASVTARATDPTTGVEVKVGDATRTLVGMARTGPAVTWINSATQRFIRSWFNEGLLTSDNTFAVDSATASGAFSEFSSVIRNEFISWLNENIVAIYSGGLYHDTINDDQCTLSLDLVTNIGSNSFASGAAGQRRPIAVSATLQIISEGYHFITVIALVAGGTVTHDGSNRLSCIFGAQL